MIIITTLITITMIIITTLITTTMIMITTLITITKIIITNIILETTVEVRQDDTRLKKEKCPYRSHIKKSKKNEIK